MKGSEIMSEIQRQTFGWWKPSPGTIYPLLSNLQSEGLIVRREDMRYEMTEDGYSYIGISGNIRDKRNSSDWNMESVIREIESFLSFIEENQEYLGEDDRKKISAIIERLIKIKGE